MDVRMNMEAREGGINTLQNPAYQVTKSTGRFQVEHGDRNGTCVGLKAGSQYDATLMQRDAGLEIDPIPA